MSDKITPGPMEWRQRQANEIEVMQTHLDGRQAQMHTATPGIIVSFDAAAMTVVVQPALQGIQQKPDGAIVPVTITPIREVPVFFPSGGGHTLTFPIAAGDECLIVFSERNIDNWYAQGGVQKPGDYRMHDINDCFALVGLRPQPKVLGKGGVGRAAGPATHAGSAQLRSDDGQTVITLDGGGNSINVKTSTTTINMDGKTGSVAVQSPTAISLTTPMTSINGNLGVTGQAGGGGNIHLTAPSVTIDSDSVTLNAPNVTITGNLTVTGEVTAGYGGASVTVTQHRHPNHNTPPIPGT